MVAIFHSKAIPREKKPPHTLLLNFTNIWTPKQDFSLNLQLTITITYNWIFIRVIRNRSCCFNSTSININVLYNFQLWKYKHWYFVIFGLQMKWDENYRCIACVHWCIYFTLFSVELSTSTEKIYIFLTLVFNIYGTIYWLTTLTSKNTYLL